MKIGFLIIAMFFIFLCADVYAILDYPTNLKVTEETFSSVTLIWDPPEDISSLIGYKIESRIGSNQYEIIEQNTGSLETTYIHTDLSKNTIYSYRVVAVYENDQISIPSNEATTYITTDPEKQKSKDSDGDTIPDNIDDCPLEPENFNKYEDSDGCPDDNSYIISNATVGSVQLLKKVYYTDGQTPIVLELSGNLKEFTINDPILFAILLNDEPILDFTPQVFVKDDGKFSYGITLPISIQDGQYTLQMTYKNEQIGTTTFDVKTKVTEPQISKNPSLETYRKDQPITFSVINPNYPKNAIKIYYWEIIDEDNQVIKPPKNDGPILEYKFHKSGTYNLKLTVIDNFDNIQHILSDSIVVNSDIRLSQESNPPPIQQQESNPPPIQQENDSDYSILIVVIIIAIIGSAVFFWLFKNRMPQFK